MKKITVLVLLLLTFFISSTSTYAASTDIIGPDIIHKQYDKILTTSDIISLYHSDLGAIILSEDNYTGYGNVIGEHTISLYASNGAVAASKTISVNVIPVLGDVQAVTDYKDIHVKDNQILTPSDVVNVLKNTGYVSITTTTQMQVISNTYEGNEETPGIYTFEFRLVNSAGIDQTFISQIFVTANTDNFVPDAVFIPDASDASKVFSFIINAFIFIALILAFFWIRKQVKKIKRGRYQ